MYTVVYALYRKEGIERSEFLDYWLNTHRPIAMRMPRVRGYELWPVIESANPLDQEIDGFVVLRFDSEQDFEYMHTSPEFVQTAADAANFTRHFTRYAVEPHVAI